MNRVSAALAATIAWGLPLLAGAVEPKQPAPSFPALEAQRGKVVLVDFWASWCGPCRQALPAYEALRKDYGARGFEVIAVDVDQHPLDGEAALRQLHLSYPQVADAQGSIAEAYAVAGMPASYLLDRHGVVRSMHVGFEQEDIEPLRKTVAQLLEEK
ncbi:MAG TPA: TlpA disulfide reductase family protein [Nevskia sp.]|jgi:thiol-disulfide isomerase/thioredoxin|nr:TlpA disulfide reductase family protein [Nevskia sp.]